MTTILVVDDSEVDRRFAGGLLAKNSDFRIGYAENGKDALDRIGFAVPDLVLTDLIMPEMDGLELVAAVRTRYPQTPVILMTAYGSEALAVDALEQGAASYVPKAQQAERLVETVNRVLARRTAERRRQRVMECMETIECSFYLDSDPALIAPLVDYAQQTLAGIGVSDAIWRIRVGIALEEALLNALYHGNLEISEQELAQARANTLGDSLAQLVEQRRGRPSCQCRRIVVQMRASSDEARFVVRDQGCGFDPAAILSGGASDRFAQGRARGLMLMRSFMDQVAFNEVGNEVTMYKVSDRCAAGQVPGAQPKIC